MSAGPFRTTGTTISHLRHRLYHSIVSSKNHNQRQEPLSIFSMNPFIRFHWWLAGLAMLHEARNYFLSIRCCQARIIAVRRTLRLLGRDCSQSTGTLYFFGHIFFGYNTQTCLVSDDFHVRRSGYPASLARLSRLHLLSCQDPSAAFFPGQRISTPRVHLSSHSIQCPRRRAYSGPTGETRRKRQGKGE